MLCVPAGALGLIFIDNEKGPYLPFALDPDTADFPFINTDQVHNVLTSG
jgi:hypothetical protein